MSNTMRSDILLESGTNELEVMEFTIAGNHFGINVNKVKEIMMYSKVNPMPNSNPFIEGIFKPREDLLTVINLPTYLGLPPSEYTERDMFIITGFNNMVTAFHVHTVEGIHRISWEDIEKPDMTIYGGQDGIATGIAKFRDKLITIIDFEKIVYDISPQTGIKISEIESMGERERSELPVLIAEDSVLLSKMITDSLTKAGYTNLTIKPNGKEAWEQMLAYKDMGGALHDHVSCIITDIEMPQMDGHHFTKLVKDDKILCDVPVVIFSSLIDENMRIKGEQVGADAQVSKPEIGKLVGIIDGLIGKHMDIKK